MLLEHRFTGCLVGIAVGDALGAPVEEIPNRPTTVQRPVREMIGGGWLALAPGQITDDTEMSLCIARSIVENKTFDPADIAQRFVAWFEDSSIGTGRTIRAAMKQLKNGIYWNKAGYTDVGLHSKGNGSVMRCAPVALYDYKKIDLLIRDTYDQSRITHPSAECMDSAVFVNFLIKYVLEGKEKNKAYDCALMCIKHHPSLYNQYRAIPTLQEKKLAGAVRDTVETAVHSFLTTTDFETAILTAVNMGGDADTRGAIIGALAGAYYGENTIPERWKTKLVDRHKKPLYEELRTLSRELYVLAQR